MHRLTIRHETRYEYDRPVSFSPHRLLMRPRDGHDLRLIEATLGLTPPGETRWLYDALGNCVCWYAPRGESTVLRIVSNLTLQRYPAPLFPIDDPHSAFPIVYDLADRIALAPFITPVTGDEAGGLLGWIRHLIGPPSEPVLFFIQRLNATIHNDFSYGERYEAGVQTPAETLARKTGTCRDFAWLMVEAVRRLGFAARFVTGYIYSAKAEAGLRGAGSTHAWCEVFLPSLGWTEFDPTNGLAESSDLIPVAATRTPTEAAPVSGGLIGDPGLSSLHVSVSVRRVSEDAAQAA